MDSRIDSSGDDGFATPAAAVISLALAVTAATVTTVSIMALHAAQADSRRLSAEFALEGDQARAALQLIGRDDATNSHWSIRDAGAATEVVAEPEALKLTLAAAAALNDADLQSLGSSHPASVRRALSAMAAASGASPTAIAGLEVSSRWALCARSAISPYGAAERPSPPQKAVALASHPSRLGELWRFRLANSEGWVDDRVVRFTGSREHPVEVVTRWFGRGTTMGGTCAEPEAVAPS